MPPSEDSECPKVYFTAPPISNATCGGRVRNPDILPRPMLRAGIVGLPNVGKSTLFNALTRTRKAEAANYTFCTIEANVGVVTVPDARLEPLARISKSARVIPATIEFVDIAGLVRGASQGEGLG